MSSVGILAYGSLIEDPGIEITPLIMDRIETETPFGVEFGRYSTTRKGAPTVVPHPLGVPIRSQILVLHPRISLQEGKNLLWRRETRNEGSEKSYPEGSSRNSVLVRDIEQFHGLDHVLYTDFHDSGKIPEPDPVELAQKAINSVDIANPGKDGISYLIQVKESGIETLLMPEYIFQILEQTGANTLGQAIQQCYVNFR